MLTVLPPLNSGMSFNELIGHVILDSICRSLTLNQIDSVMDARVSWDDTVNAVFKYMTTLVDVNPLTVFGITNTYAAGRRRSVPKDVRNALRNPIRKHSPAPLIDDAIATSDYIFIGTISSVTNLVDSSALSARTVRVATAIISQKILGQVVPPCSLPNQMTTTTEASQCITFDMSLELIGQVSDDKNIFLDSTQAVAFLPSINQQYLIFLNVRTVCGDSASLYYTLFPGYWIGNSYGVFKVSSGRISDATNLFGLGVNPLLSDVVAVIESRLTAIKSWVP